MARKPSDIVQPNLRIREDLRRQLEKEAKRRGVSLNQEMTHRLGRSLEADAARSIDVIAADLANIHSRISAANHEANMLGDLLRATEALLKQIDTEANQATQKAAKRVRDVIAMIDSTAAAAVRKAHTTGSGNQ